MLGGSLFNMMGLFSVMGFAHCKGLWIILLVGEEKMGESLRDELLEVSGGAS